MKRMKVLFVLIVLAVFFVSPLAAQSTTPGTAKGLCSNGLTGIIATPSARIGWESKKIGLDAHYSFMFHNADYFAHVPTATISLFQVVEVALALEIDDEELTNFFCNVKGQIYKSGGAALAVGGNIEFYVGPGTSDTDKTWVSSSVFFIATYSGNFFKMPAVTSALFGWQFFYADDFQARFNFSMGFEMALFPSVFHNFVYWITDFGNYSYVQVPASGINADNRGSFNTGIRFDVLKKGNMKLQFDIVGTDLLDTDRGLMAAATFGIGF